MNFSNDASSVRVTFFKENGKYYTTEAIKWADGMYDKCLILKAFAITLEKHLWDEKSKRYRLYDMMAICLEPYHEHSHPIMFKNIEDAIKTYCDNIKE